MPNAAKMSHTNDSTQFFSQELQSGVE
jgi:hypothetical protein